MRTISMVQQRTRMAGLRVVRLGRLPRAQLVGDKPQRYIIRWILQFLARLRRPPLRPLDSGPVSGYGAGFRRNHHGVGEAT